MKLDMGKVNPAWKHSLSHEKHFLEIYVNICPPCQSPGTSEIQDA